MALWVDYLNSDHFLHKTYKSYSVINDTDTEINDFGYNELSLDQHLKSDQNIADIYKTTAQTNPSIHHREKKKHTFSQTVEMTRDWQY